MVYSALAKSAFALCGGQQAHTYAVTFMTAACIKDLGSSSAAYYHPPYRPRTRQPPASRQGVQVQGEAAVT